MGTLVNDKYREAAERIMSQRFPNDPLRPRVHTWASVQTVQNEGAFVEVQIWVPKSELDSNAGQ